MLSFRLLRRPAVENSGRLNHGGQVFSIINQRLNHRACQTMFHGIVSQRSRRNVDGTLPGSAFKPARYTPV